MPQRALHRRPSPTPAPFPARESPKDCSRRGFGLSGLTLLGGAAAALVCGGAPAGAAARTAAVGSDHYREPVLPQPAERPARPASLMPSPWVLDAAAAWQFGGAARPVVDDVELRHWFRRLVRCGRRTLHVSGAGNDANAGTATAPFRQISRAIAAAAPGDLILVGSGTYGYTEVRGFRGRTDAWLGIMSVSPDVNAVITVPPPTDNFVNIIDSQYVGLYGFEVCGDQDDSNTNGSGISVYGNSHHVAIWRNDVHDFPGGGINCFDVDGSHDLLDISYNVIHATSRYSPSNTSGISIYASRDLTNGATFPGGYGYRIVGNYIYDVVCTVPFTPGGYDVVTDGNGISLDSMQSTYGYTKPVLVAGNLVTGCGGRGVLAFNSVNVDMLRNTAVGNLRTDSPAINGGSELEGKSGRSVCVIANAILPLHTPNSTDALSTYRRNVILGGRQAVPAGNTDRRTLGMSYFTGPVTAAMASGGTRATRFEPRRG